MFNEDVKSYYEVTPFFFFLEKQAWRRGQNTSPKGSELNFNIRL
jgi:hypothetical protein